MSSKDIEKAFFDGDHYNQKKSPEDNKQLSLGSMGEEEKKSNGPANVIEKLQNQLNDSHHIVRRYAEENNQLVIDKSELAKHLRHLQNDLDAVRKQLQIVKDGLFESERVNGVIQGKFKMLTEIHDNVINKLIWGSNDK